MIVYYMVLNLTHLCFVSLFNLFSFISFVFHRILYFWENEQIHRHCEIQRLNGQKIVLFEGHSTRKTLNESSEGQGSGQSSTVT